MNAMTDRGAQRTASVADWYASTKPMCVARLREAHDRSTGLFSRQLRNGEWGATGDAEAATSTAICLVGLSRAGIDAEEIGVDPKRSLEAVAGLLRRYPGGTGLAIWGGALHGGPNHGAFFPAQGSVATLVPTLTTMELAWLLSGLLHEQRREGSPELATAIDVALVELLGRQGKTGLFAHAGATAPLRDRLRRHVANFADQIYPVQALAFAAMASSRADARDAARRCAEALLALRGPQHQWWWHYNPEEGSVSRRFPVYSVHQHGMAPMAFMALAAAGAADLRERAWAGLEWLRANELRLSMIDEKAGTIWRDIQIDERGLSKQLHDAREALGIDSDRVDPARLRLNRETRPYEWAWCLMAGALQNTPAPAGHLA
jgi:hypothetical protein